MNNKKVNIVLIIINVILLGYLVFVLVENNVIKFEQDNLLADEYITYSNESIYELYVSTDTNKTYIVEKTYNNWVKNVLEADGVYETITYMDGDIYLDGENPVVLTKDENGNATGAKPTNVVIEEKDINYYNNVDGNDIYFSSHGSDGYGSSKVVNSLEKTINTNTCTLTDIMYINAAIE